MKIVFLGTSCAEPTAENGFTSIILKAGSLQILIDASGNPVQSILKAGCDPLAVDLLILTHYHADHIAGFPALVQTLSCMGRNRNLIVVCSSPTEKKALGLVDVLKLHPESLGYPLTYQDSYSGSGIHVRLVEGNHSVPSSMVLISENDTRILYTADTAFSSRIGETARGCQALIHEATFSQARIQEFENGGHSSAYQAGLSAAASGVKTLFLCHICAHQFENSHSAATEAESAFAGEVIVPQTFRWYKL